MFSDTQKAALAAPLNGSVVKERAQAGRKLSYIEGWWAISEANRIFGFDGWTRETITLNCVAEKPRKVGQGDGFGVTYIARVRVTVGDIVREGCGTGHGIDRDLGQAHESALKEAETDAMKRALMTFGNPFGLALYDKTQSNVEQDDAPRPSPPTSAPAPARPVQDADIEEGVRNWTALRRAEIDEAARIPDLYQWQDQHEAALHRLKSKHKSAFDGLMQYYQAKFDILSKKEAAE